jgi:hypothetical protein
MRGLLHCTMFATRCSLLGEGEAADRRRSLALQRRVAGMRAGGELQHRGALPDAEAGQQHHLAARKLQRVMMLVGTVRIDLPESRDILSQLLVGKESERVVTLDLAVEHELRPRKKAHRHAGLSDGGEATCDGADELRGNKLVANLGRTVRDVLQAVVTHGWHTPVEVLYFAGAPKKEDRAPSRRQHTDASPSGCSTS